MRPREGDTLAVVGTHRKLLCFPLGQVPRMSRGAGVILQRYKDATLADARAFRRAAGLSWTLGEKTRTEADVSAWFGDRGQAGRMVPSGFPKSGRFG